MCGRFTQHSSMEELQEFYDLVDMSDFDIEPAYNISPRSFIYGFAKQRFLMPMYWGLVPSWWRKTLKDVPSTHNARAETAHEKPMFRAAFQRRRCLIPANGFFEWTGPKGARQPWYIHSADNKPLTFAGLYDIWADPISNDELLSATILVCEPNDFMSDIHNRMPVILGKDQWEDWLNEPNQDLLKPCPDDWLNAYKVTTKMSSGRYQEADAVEQVRELI